MIRFSNDDIKYLAIDLPDTVKHYKYNGDYEREIAEIGKYLSQNLPHGLYVRLIIEREFAIGLKQDYNIDIDALLMRVQRKYPSCTKENLEYLITLGQADYILRNGEMYFQNDAASNIRNSHEVFLHRLTSPDWCPNYSGDKRNEENAKIMAEKGSRAFRFTVKEVLTVDESYQRPGEMITVHLPYPAVCQSQPESEIKLIDVSDKSAYISSSLQRTICIRKPYEKDEIFSVVYSYVNRAKYHVMDPSRVSATQPNFYTEEFYPHIRFTPLIKDLAREIAGDEKNPLLLARAAYDWVTKNVKYSYMRDYLYIDNIPEFAIFNRRGDCGVMALLFITLCRCMGVPAKWESGSAARPDYIGSHDWAMFYVEPFGWLYADPSFGGGALRRGNEFLWNHYFGNLDPYRLVCNNEFQTCFDPPKQYMRKDPYDNQSGEAEYDSYGLSGEENTRDREILEAEEIE